MKPTLPNFDGIARPYRLLEYASMGRLLETTRFAFMHEIENATKALVLGDGDGRFTARLLEQNRNVRVTAVDISAEMLRLLRERCVRTSDRVKTVQNDALTFCREDCQGFDLVATHFFVDCLTQSEVEELASLLAHHALPGARWVISEFVIPHGVMRFPAQLLVRGLYRVFRLVTGLKVSQLPNHRSALESTGFARLETRSRLGGILCSELWVRCSDKSTDAILEHSRLT